MLYNSDMVKFTAVLLSQHAAKILASTSIKAAGFMMHFSSALPSFLPSFALPLATHAAQETETIMKMHYSVVELDPSSSSSFLRLYFIIGHSGA